MWDNVAGVYFNNWYPDSVPGSSSVRNELAANATKLLSLYKNDVDALNNAQVAGLASYADLTTAVTKNELIEKTFVESYQLARDVVYKGLALTWVGDKQDKVACPLLDYQAKVVATVEPRFVLAGRRLAIVLAKFAAQLRVLGLAQ
ncbi:Aste57867_3716 [Aphanomyces stellatus]|uniref:Aste57867_3716 protein n=1 Tax=Aphanomyces stellatus TaxID=120398 RepID=A0A485KE42_9STRA|nr:hypothetical protein As57867_003705 [Aphanomyces stellatus]VFT80870.1 Aste57867_3716 [Aphanomyces stellatus]